MLQHALLALAGALAHSPVTVAQTFPLYGQCGGSGFTSMGTCASGSSCQSQNPYYCTICFPRRPMGKIPIQR